MSTNTIYAHVHDEDAVKSQVKYHNDGRRYAVVDLGPDLTIFPSRDALDRLRAALDAVAAELALPILEGEAA